MGASVFLSYSRKLHFLFTLGLALAIVRGVAPLSTLDLTRKEKKVRFTFQSCFVVFFFFLNSICCHKYYEIIKYKLFEVLTFK